MAARILEGGSGFNKALDDIGKKMRGQLDVGFMEGATYPDGTPVAAVAFWNEYGVPERSQPARPFFRGMIAEESGTWPGKMAKIAKATNCDGEKILGLMGEDIEGALKQSINQLDSPPLSPVTIAKKGFDKPLIDTSHMVNSITHKVDE